MHDLLIIISSLFFYTSFTLYVFICTLLVWRLFCWCWVCVTNCV